MLGMLIWRLFSFIYNHLDTAPADVNVGLVFNMAIPKPHGYARIKLDNGQYITIAFVVDKPRLLFLPSKLTVAEIFNQFSKMGLYCHSLKIKHGFWTEIQYARSNLKPLVIDPYHYQPKEYVVKTIM